MSSIDALRRRIDRMLAAIEEQRGHDRTEEESLFNMHLFSEQEQTELQELTDLLLLKCSQSDTGRLNLSELSNQELHTFSLWLHLQQALDKEDIAVAAEYRRALAWSYDSLVETFFTISESDVPGHDRTLFRSDKARLQRALAASRVHSSDIDTMRSWCEKYVAA